jgi:hypothetical protein
MRNRRTHYDVTNTVHLADPAVVQQAVLQILERCYPGIDASALPPAFNLFSRLYAGVLPGYHGCDTWYHDAQHSLDCALAMARLFDGHERSVAERQRLGPRRGVLGIICALFHDEGYIRRWDDPVHNGAEYTLTHVARSGEFLAEHLPALGFSREAKMVRELVHYTGFEKPLDRIAINNGKDRQLGFLLATADLFAQLSDRCYPEKCRTFLFHEFKACGLAGPARPGGPKPWYLSPEDLISKTPEFIQKLFDERLDGYFKSAYRYFEKHFEGDDLYMLAIREHLAHVQHMLEQREWSMLRRRPRSINARELRRILHIRISEARPGSGPPAPRRTRRRTPAGRRRTPTKPSLPGV